MSLHERVDNDFTYHATIPEQVRAYGVLRDLAKTLAHAIVDHVPISREQDAAALTRLEECVMHANAGIARAG